MTDDSRVSPHWPFKYRDGQRQQLKGLEFVDHMATRFKANASTYLLSDSDAATLAAWGIDHTKPGYWKQARGILLARFGISPENLLSMTAVDALAVLASDKPRVNAAPLTDLESSIIKQLEGAAYTCEGLALVLETPTSTIRDALRRLKVSGLVGNKRGRGYYRPDAPPNDVSQT